MSCYRFFSEEKKLSIAALSQTLPERLMLQFTPWSATSFWNCSLVYWADSSGRKRFQRPGRTRPVTVPQRPFVRPFVASIDIGDVFRGGQISFGWGSGRRWRHNGAVEIPRRTGSGDQRRNG
jgi:hypothetical protein